MPTKCKTVLILFYKTMFCCCCYYCENDSFTNNNNRKFVWFFVFCFVCICKRPSLTRHTVNIISIMAIFIIIHTKNLIIAIIIISIISIIIGRKYKHLFVNNIIYVSLMLNALHRMVWDETGIVWTDSVFIHKPQ